jgi:histone acetyltransferase HTATIP
MEWPRPKVDPAAAAAPASGVASGAATPSQPGSGKPGTLGLTAALKRLPQTPVSKAKGVVGRNMSLLKKATIASALQFPDSPSGIGTKRKAPLDEADALDAQDESVSGSQDGDAAMDLDEEDEVAVPVDPSAAPVYMGKESEIEKLRHSGSMTQSAAEIARVKNLNRIQMGRHEVEAWYFSPYPAEYAHLPVLFLCEFCLSYFPSQFMLGRHRKNCTLVHPPGNEVYRDSDGPGEEISFFEIDGRRQGTWCRNLSLLSKCFLDQ